MQEFSSVSASAYDADSLTTQLNEQSRAGWDVISIVAAGTSVVAYLSREAPDEAADDAAETDAAVDADAPAEDAPAEETVEEVVDEVAEEAPAEDVVEAPIEEPAGWAAAPESDEPDAAAVDPTPTDVPVDAGVAAAAATATAAPAEPEPQPQPEPEPQPQSEPAVPAGWYADPSGRYELRYWDGSAWTEHVSRAGQQYTDPPVA